MCYDNVIIKNSKKVVFLIVILTLCSCIEKIPDKSECKYFYLDVLGDSHIDTLLIRNNYSDNSYVDIVLLQHDKEDKIVTLKPRLESLKEYITTNPQIEIVRLESNYTQSDDKELRIIIRNTDIIPDYIFIDLKYDNQWVVKRYYVCNSNTEKQVFLAVINIDRPLVDEFGGDKLLDQGQILNLFSSNKLPLQ